MKAVLFSSGKGFTQVNGLHEATEAIRQLGGEPVRAAHIPLITKASWSGQVKAELGIHIYFIGSDGLEIGYYTPCMHTVQLLDKPCKWSDYCLRLAEDVPLPDCA